MSINAPPKPKRETWRDWQPEGTPEPEIMLRDEFVTRLQAVDVDVDEGDLRFWEYHGVLPRAVKKWHEGANRVFYPRWMISTVTRLRALQETGVPLRAIGPRLRADAVEDIHMLSLLTEFAADPDTNVSGATGDALLRRCGDHARYDALYADIITLAAHFSSLSGNTVASVDVTFRGDDGMTLRGFRVDVHDQTNTSNHSENNK